MNVIDTLSYYVNMIGAVVLVTMGAAVAFLYYMVKVRKVTSTVEKIDTSHFRKEDSIYYVPFDDVVTKDGTTGTDGMIVFGQDCFVGGISVRGFDYPAASTDERIDAQIQSVQFFNVVEKPISFRQSVKKIDLSENIQYHEEILKRLAKDHMELEADYKETLIAAEDYLDQPERYLEYEKHLNNLQKLMTAKKHQIEEVNAEIGYMKAMSGDITASSDGALAQKESQILFTYKYNASEYSRELSKVEIYAEAMKKLSSMAQAYGNALAAAHFRSRRLSGGEIVRLMRKHTSPLTGENFSLDDLLDSSYTHLFISCDSLIEECKKKIGEDVYNQQMEEYDRQLKELLRMQEMERQRMSVILKEDSLNEAAKQMSGKVDSDG